ncbi:MAG TPA: CHAT domain-containing protein [Solirubrobacteraceae bacterium]|jgi:CHAT domain-containing protein|nr:CHAT domain-containing protein [Solirubrobacteraceae bacterium]
MVIEVPGEDPLALAQSAFDLVEADAGAAARMAERALQLARAQRAPEAEVAALHALSFARHELGDARAISAIRAAIRIGERHGLARRTALARRRLALDLAGRGAITLALRELETARASLDAHEQARSEVFRIGILWYAGTATDPTGDTDRALATLRRHRDVFWEAQLLRNRGGLLTERGDVTAAERDLLRARELFARLGAKAAAFATESQLVRIALTRGDLPECLARLDAIDVDDISALGTAELELLRAQALAAARLWSEALEALGQAQSIWQRAGRDDHGGRLEAIRLSLLAGDAAGARALAIRAQRSFAAQQRHLHAARAAGLALAAAIAAGGVRPAALRSGRRAAATLAAAGWRQDALALQVAVARAAIELGSIGVARRELTACSPLLRRARVAERIEGEHVEALIRLAEGDRRGAQRSARSGLRLLEGYRAALGASDLRATASAIGAELAQLGVRMALMEESPGPLFEWAEALRGSALRLAPVTPPRSPELREGMTELRLLNAEIARAEESGRATRTLVTRQARLETRIRRLSRHAAGDTNPTRAAPKRREIAAALGDRALVTYVELDGTLTALTLAGGRLDRHDVGAVDAVLEQLEWLRFGLTRLARMKRDAPQRRAALDGARASAQELDGQLLGPLTPATGDRELVIVPTGSLHDLPWSMLPSLWSRPVVVSPSAAAWWALQAPRRRRRSSVVLVGGPRLRHATAEIGALAHRYPEATVLTGRTATAAAALRALDGATLAHLACHGHFRADSPLFSALELADGPLNAYELQRLRRAPELIVLSSCDLAASHAHPGDELLGFAAALLDMGTRTIIASVVPVPDAAAKRLMLGLHGHLIAGASPAEALARAQAALPSRESGLGGFVCLGAG